MYYYLVASLPPLVQGEPPPFTPEDYRFKCQGVLTEEHLAELDRIVEGHRNELRTPFGRRWRDMETSIRNVAARVRAGREGIDESPYIESVSACCVAVEHDVQHALSQGNPMEQEFALDRVRWNALDELSLEEPFGLAPALAYAVKLRIAKRWADLSEDEGRKTVKEFVDRNTQEIREAYKVEPS